jgi:hypothetical protein
LFFGKTKFQIIQTTKQPTKMADIETIDTWIRDVNCLYRKHWKWMFHCRMFFFKFSESKFWKFNPWQNPNEYLWLKFNGMVHFLEVSPKYFLETSETNTFLVGLKFWRQRNSIGY